MLLCSNVQAINLTEELRISRQLDTPALQGEAVWLNADSGRFLSLSNQAVGAERIGGVILMHDTGAHADWQTVIGPLRAFLPKRGWDLLSLQMPVRTPSDRTISEGFWQETRSRIQAAVDHFSGQENTNLVLIGHGLGAQAALDYLSTQPSPQVRALVAIGLPLDEGSADKFTTAMEGLTGPMLDIFGSQDRPAVTDSAERRLSAGKKNPRGNYRQDRVIGADHYFSGLDSSLQRRIDAWLKRVAQGMEMKN
jgi:pimeloyl-ACP methyl ester carboxylesterase